MNIARRRPFEGAPVLHTPTLFGATTGQAFLYRIPVTGQRPIRLTVEGLPEGLSFDGSVLRGSVSCDCTVTLTLHAENNLGMSEKQMRLVIAPDTVQLTPLLGFTTWNAYGPYMTQKTVLDVADRLLDTGLADYGYSYVNVDSGWQGQYGGPCNAIMPNERFPDMKALCDRLHMLGFRAGIYSTPMLSAWGCPSDIEMLPGCTLGEPDERFPEAKNGGIGRERREAENVRQWCEWGFDYLKYDWVPTDGYNAHRMKEELQKSGRTFTYCTSVFSDIRDAEVFRQDTSSWRDNPDSHPNWENITIRMETLERWRDHVCAGHFYDLDMLCVGRSQEDPENKGLSEAEKVFAYTMRAFFCSPVQISSPLDTLTEFELDLFSNDEIIAVNQDALVDYPRRLSDFPDGVRVYERSMENGDTAVAVFHMEDSEEDIRLLLPERSRIRDLWRKEDLPKADEIVFRAEPHAAYVFRISGGADPL